jgi:hypothetical protein
MYSIIIVTSIASFLFLGCTTSNYQDLIKQSEEHIINSEIILLRALKIDSSKISIIDGTPRINDKYYIVADSLYELEFLTIRSYIKDYREEYLKDSVWNFKPIPKSDFDNGIQYLSISEKCEYYSKFLEKNNQKLTDSTVIILSNFILNDKMLVTTVTKIDRLNQYGIEHRNNIAMMIKNGEKVRVFYVFDNQGKIIYKKIYYYKWY